MLLRESVRIWFIVLVATIGIQGCGPPGDRPELGEVTGRVTMDGKPLANAKVMFHPSGEEGGRRSIGVTDENGRYELMYMQGADTVYGAKIGPHVVNVSAARSEDDPDGESEETVPDRYHGRNSELTAVVESGANEEMNFELHSQ